MNLNLCRLLVLLSLILVGCNKNDPEPISQQRSKLLAGNMNESKKWKLVSIIFGDVKSSYPLNIDPCFLNNVYTFTNKLPQSVTDNSSQLFANTSSQTYEITEGASKCKADDQSITEQGSWAFTQDGKFIIIDATLYNPNGSFGNIIGKVETFTSTSFQFSFFYKKDSYKFSFEPITK